MRRVWGVCGQSVENDKGMGRVSTMKRGECVGRVRRMIRVWGECGE
jgi:hypothetical protein